MVVANTVAALSEISEMRGTNALNFNSNTVSKVIAAMNESTEWGQVFILDSLIHYSPADAREAESIIERVVPRLAHANASVVMSAVKVVVRFIDFLTSAESIRNWCKKLAPPLVSLISTEPEIQYVALKNINLIIQKRNNILDKEIKVFFCKFNDPIYVKLEKLEIMMKLVDNKNIDIVLAELKEYSTGVDVDFVRKAI
jgi:AP-1 complex subunit beta-1